MPCCPASGQSAVEGDRSVTRDGHPGRFKYCGMLAERQLERERRLESMDKRRRVEHMLGCCGGRPRGISSVVNV